MKTTLLLITLLLSFFSQTSLADYERCVEKAKQNINNAAETFRISDNTYQMYVDAMIIDKKTGLFLEVSQKTYDNIWNKFKRLQATYMKAFGTFQKELGNCRISEESADTCRAENNIAYQILDSHFYKIDNNVYAGRQNKVNGILNYKYKAQFEKLYAMKRAWLAGNKWIGDQNNFNHFFQGQKDNGLWSKRDDVYNSTKCIKAETETETNKETETDKETAATEDENKYTNNIETEASEILNKAENVKDIAVNPSATTKHDF